MNKKNLVIALILVDIPIVIGVVLWFLVLAPPVQNFMELPGMSLSESEKYELAKDIGHSERLMWEAYYKDDKVTIAKELVTVLQVQFGIDAIKAVRIAEPLAQAALAFAGSTEDYEEKVLPHLIDAYTKIQEAAKMSFNPREAAAAELGWWVARRTPGKDSPENVGKEIAKLYSAVYGVDNGDIQRAGRLRATAANKRDTNADAPPWSEIEAIITEGYIALITGIMKGG